MGIHGMYEVPIYNLYMEYILYISYYIHNLNKYNIRDNVLVCMHTYRCIDIIICRIYVYIYRSQIHRQRLALVICHLRNMKIGATK